MRKLMNQIDRFCYKHPRFGIPNLMLVIVIGSGALWLLMQMDTTGRLFEMLCFSAQGVLHGQIWRLVTFAFMPTNSNLVWLLVSLYFYYFIGSALEREWGTAKLTIYYVSGMLLTAVYGIVVSLIVGQDVILSAVYLNLSLFFAFATLFPDMQVLLFFIIPIKIKWLAYLDAALFAYEMIRPGVALPLRLLPIIALLNYLVFCGDWLFDLIRPSRIRQRQKTVNFKREARRINREQRERPYTRKCAVCGRTDTEHPELEFRYCSRCAGYHCFCQDHINNHIHFTE